MFEKIGDRKPLSQQIEEEITKAIRAGRFEPGKKLPTEQELCAMFNVSRTAVREAIKVLSAKGLVYVRKGSGVYVTEISLEHASDSLNMFFELASDRDLILETIDARLVIEPGLAAFAAQKRTAQHLEFLGKNMDEMRRCNLKDKVREAELDNIFHSALLSIAHNRVLHLMLSPLFNLMAKFKEDVFAKTVSTHMKEEKDVLLDFHQGILDALTKQDPAQAEQIMRQHLIKTRANYMKSIGMK